MKRLRILVARLVSAPRSWFRAMNERQRLENEMEIELANHLESLTGDLIRAGSSPKEARRRAHIALGSAVVHKDAMRSGLGLRFVDRKSVV